jgi:hypothetical protein
MAMVAAGCGGRYPGTPITTTATAPSEPEEITEPAPLPNPQPRERPEPRAEVVPPRRGFSDPKLTELVEAIDPTEYVRWPLTGNQHPALEPAYAIAAAFAQPGISWLDLCRLGAQNRRGGGSADQLEYLRAWCSVANRDARAAVARLAPLLRSGVLGMPAAVRIDLANIVVDTGVGDEAESLLARAQVDDLAVLDLVAASFAEVGRTSDALIFAERALAVNDRKRPLDHCMRLTRRALLVNPGSRMRTIQDLASFEDVPGCAKLLHELKCWHAGICDQYLIEHGVSEERLDLGDVYRNWPTPSSATKDWLSAARRANYTMADGADDAAVSALEGALRSATCTGPFLDEIRELARRLKQRKHEAMFDERLDLVILTPESVCVSR